MPILVSKHITMETDTNYSNFSDSEKKLNEIIENRKKYLPETVESAIIELQHSGRVFSDEELQKINTDIKNQRDNAAVGGHGSSGIFNSITNIIWLRTRGPHYFTPNVRYTYLLCYAVPCLAQ